MSLLQFDPSGAMHDEYGIAESQFSQCLEQLFPLRKAMLAEDAADATPFLRLPETQLEAYETQREASELGRIFTLANGMHDRLDAIVVLGTDAWALAARAIRDACCHPYHNELSRGGRGSKPRMYFAGNRFDNDALAGLLERLAAGTCEDNPVSGRWGLCVISETGQALETAVALRHSLAALKKSLQTPGSGELAEFVFPVTRAAGGLHRWAAELGCREIFSLPEAAAAPSAAVAAPFSALAAPGLLPAAFLGLDCMQLLVGAAAMNRHFLTAAPEENVVLKYVAVNHLLARHRDCPAVISPWCEALHTLGLWHDQLRDGRPLQYGKPVVHNLIVKHFRSDPLEAGALEVGPERPSPDDSAALSQARLPDLQSAVIAERNSAWHAAGHPTTDILLPTIDTHVLGQLFQMWMIAAVLQCRLQWQKPPICPPTRDSAHVRC